MLYLLKFQSEDKNIDGPARDELALSIVREPRILAVSFIPALTFWWLYHEFRQFHFTMPISGETLGPVEWLFTVSKEQNWRTLFRENIKTAFGLQEIQNRNVFSESNQNTHQWHTRTELSYTTNNKPSCWPIKFAIQSM